MYHSRRIIWKLWLPFRKNTPLTFRFVMMFGIIFLFMLFIYKDEQKTDVYRQLFVDGDHLQFLINQDSCPTYTFLMIYIHSSPEHFERRRVIRNTWASHPLLEKHNAKLIFVMGKVTNVNLYVFVKIENELHKDIIQANFTDTYRNLTFKAITGLKWVTENCHSAKFILKTDDDIIVDINAVISLLKSYNDNKWAKKNLLVGLVWKHMPVQRFIGSKWYTTYGEYPDDFYHKYCSGSAYIMTYDLVKSFYLNSRVIPFFWVDDYYVTGLLAHALNVTPFPINDRYAVLSTLDIRKELQNNYNLTFIHSPNTSTSLYIWQKYLEREQTANTHLIS